MTVPGFLPVQNAVSCSEYFKVPKIETRSVEDKGWHQLQVKHLLWFIKLAEMI